MKCLPPFGRALLGRSDRSGRALLGRSDRSGRALLGRSDRSGRAPFDRTDRPSQRSHFRLLILATAGFVMGACAQGINADDDGQAPGATGSSVSGKGGAAVTGGVGGNGTTGPGGKNAGGSNAGGSNAGGSNAGGSGGGGPSCSESPCKLTSPQCGCTGALRCSINDGSGARECVTVGGDAIGEDCQIGTCVAGAMCIRIDGSNTCRAFCDDNGDCTAPGGQCTISLAVNASVTLCSDNCGPIDGSGCASGRKCDVIGRDDNSGSFTRCGGTGAGTQDNVCTSHSDCASGFGCIEIGANSSCLQYCQVGVTTCPGALNCDSLAPSGQLGGQEIGICK